MLFSSYTFLILFLPIVVAVFHLLDATGRDRAARYWLVAVSFWFYVAGEFRFFWILPLSITLNYFAGRTIERWRRAGCTGAMRTLLASGVCANLAVLGYYKYRGFFAETLNWLTGANVSVGAIVLPLGISFFTFLQIAYLVDASRRDVESAGFLNYMLFVTFFPHLIAGPIVHHSELMPQFDRRTRDWPVWEHLSVGVTLFVIGLFKKVAIADSVSAYATTIFETADAGNIPGFYAAWAGTAAYAFQIYFDFSGYSDMAIGLGHLFGIRLPVNFLSPYKATSIIDFWRRWHITLSRFLRDYLYVSLGGSRFGKLLRYRNLMLTMLLGGMWHSAGWTFIIWGGLHGLYLAVNHLWRDRFGDRSSTPSPAAVTWVKRAFTLYLVTVAWVFFRAGTLHGAMEILASMHGLRGLSMTAPFSRWESSIWLISLLGAVWLLPNTTELLRTATDSLRSPAVAEPALVAGSRIQWRAMPVWAVAVALLAITSTVLISRGGEFIYYHF